MRVAGGDGTSHLFDEGMEGEKVFAARLYGTEGNARSAVVT